MRLLQQLMLLTPTLAISLVAAPIRPVDFVVPAKLSDVAEPLPPSAIRLEGWLGARVAANATNRLMTADLEALLAGFRHKPGSHPWIGEHIGKWLHAATLTWATTGDPALRRRLDYAARELIQAQESDGYLGTYVPEKRFGLYREADWDVWSHKYCLIGLLTYYQFTGEKSALDASRKAAELLIRTFGPERKSILSAGTHKGMAATSVLEPIVLLYRFTGDPAYLDFARYLVQSWDEPSGPGILQSLLRSKPVNQTANGKAYEMLSNLVGLCELARATGDRQFLQAVLNGWQDIVSHRLYLTGSASAHEHFQPHYVLPNDPAANICETCVTVTWMQLNWQLLRLTGEARFADELEKSAYNHLSAAQHPRGDDWCYYTPLEGRKQYDAGITCCHSSGPRGLALLPLTLYLKGRIGGTDALLVNTLESSTVTTWLGGQLVTVEQRSEFPLRGHSVLMISSEKPARFALQVRVPPWATPLTVKVNGMTADAPAHDGWLALPAREWRNGDSIALSYTLASRLVTGDHGNRGLAAMDWGPFVLAYDEAQNPGLPSTDVGWSESKVEATVGSSPSKPLSLQVRLRSLPAGKEFPGKLVPFADAGLSGATFRVWLQALPPP